MSGVIHVCTWYLYNTKEGVIRPNRCVYDLTRMSIYSWQPSIRNFSPCSRRPHRALPPIAHTFLRSRTNCFRENAEVVEFLRGGILDAPSTLSPRFCTLPTLIIHLYLAPIPTDAKKLSCFFHGQHAIRNTSINTKSDVAVAGRIHIHTGEDRSKLFPESKRI